MVKLRGQNFWEVGSEYNYSWSWKVLLGLRDKVKQHIGVSIRNGRNTSVWYDKGPLCQ